mmetsp:Transcript_38581/g.119224  ORF Transcript_38581/g.119224 Transcript_38581/m.119224 type:complete len:216 (-) Transcript_38581:572-1219(-)
MSCTRSGKYSRAMRSASLSMRASWKSLSSVSGALLRSRIASASLKLPAWKATRPCAVPTMGMPAGSCASATRIAASKSCWWTYMSIASRGLPALTNESSAMRNSPWSSQCIAFLRKTYGSFCGIAICAHCKASSNFCDSSAASMPASTSEKRWSSCAPSCASVAMTRLSTTFLTATGPPLTLATRTTSSHMPASRYMLTARFQSLPATKYCSACL